MSGTEVAASIPFTAWEQAALIGLFIVFAVSLLAWFSRQSDKWQKFMFDIDAKWREFNKEQREENNCAMADVNSSLGNLTKTTEGLVLEVKEMRTESRAITEALHDHDLQAKEILEQVKRQARVTKPKKADEQHPTA
jgi:hypothetical protein